MTSRLSRSALFRALMFFAGPLRRARLGACLTLALLMVCAMPARADVSVQERIVLLNLFGNTNGDSWSDKTGWNTSFNPLGFNPVVCSGGATTWFGLFCTADDHIRAINLDKNNLTGHLPPLDGLTYLQTFNVSNGSGVGAPNQIGGQLPNLSGLTSLQSFYAVGQQFTGPIPALPSSIQTFMANNNQLTGPIPDLSGLTSLTYFTVSNNQLSGPITTFPPASLKPSANPFIITGAVLCNPSGDTNALSPTANTAVTTAWNTATGTADWHAGCVGVAAPVFTTPADLPNAVEGVYYSVTIAATGATSFSVIPSAPPPSWLSLNTTTGVLSGTPPAGSAGGPPHTFYIVATNAGGVVEREFSMSIKPTPPPAPVFTTPADLPSATEGAAYSTTLAATSATSFALAAGNVLPAWLKLNSTTGELSGQPPTGAAAAGPFHFTITATNAGGTASRDFTLTVKPGAAPVAAPVFSTAASLPNATEGASYSVTLAASGSPTFGLAAGSALPAWLKLNTATGALTGTPPAGAAAAGPYNFTITAANAAGTASRIFTLKVLASGGTSPGPGGNDSPAGPGAHDGIYRIINADGSAGDYLSVHTNGSDMLATIYRSAGPANGASFALTDAGASVAALYRWGSFDLYNGTVSGNNAALTGYAGYGLCNASVSLAFSGAGGTIKVALTSLSGFAPPGARAADCSDAGQTLTLRQDVSAPASAVNDGVYRITNADGSLGDYVSVHSGGGVTIATLYRSADASSSAGFQVIDGGASVATLYRWGSFDLYSGSGAATLTGYAQYGLCKAKGTISFNGGTDGSIRITPDGPSEFAPPGAHPTCSAASQTLTMHRDF